MSFSDVKAASGRFEGVTRPYTEQDVQRLRGSVKVEYTLAQRGADQLWELLKSEDYVHALGALSGNQVSVACKSILLPCLVPAQPWPILLAARASPSLAANLCLPLPAAPHPHVAGGADGQGWAEGHLPVWMAGGS
jgi:isocitrate lyase